MSKLSTYFSVVERYGLRLGLKQLAEALNLSLGSIKNQMARGEFPIATYIDGKQRFADARAVADHFDRMYEKSRAHDEETPV